MSGEGVALVCPYCGAALYVETETVGPPYLTYERPESIQCDGECGAAWEPTGKPREGPRWLRWPDLYDPPAALAAQPTTTEAS